MSDDRRKLVERYSGRTMASPPSETQSESDNDYQPSSTVSANRPPEIMLELRFKTGDSLALGYALLVSAVWKRSEGIVLEFTTHRVQLNGRNLREIYRAIVAHRLAYVQELTSRTDDQPEGAAVVASIEVSDL